MATITQLSVEVIEIILSYKDISIEDIINFRCVCKQFKDAAKYDKLMNKKFSQRWPTGKKLYDKQTKENEQAELKKNEEKDKKRLNFMETGINCVKQLHNDVFRIIQKYCDSNMLINNITDNEAFSDTILEQTNLIEKFNPHNFDNFEADLTQSFFIDESNSLLTQSSRRDNCNLTERYFSRKYFHYLRRFSVIKKSNKYLKQCCKKYLFERAATFASQMFQPQKNIFYSSVKASLDNIALEVLNYLKEKHPDHSIFSTSAEYFTYWKNNNIIDNYWSVAEGTQIIDTLKEYIFGKLNFCLNESKELKYLCIEYVLENKCGRVLILLIIYLTVARRLGLHCDIIELKGTYYLFWKPSIIYFGNQIYICSSRNDKCFTISSGKFPDCIIEKSNPEDWNMRIRNVVHHLLNIYKSTILYHCTLEMKFHVPKTRSQEVKFAVGMIVKHKSIVKSTDCSTGVIIAWHQNKDRDDIKRSKEPCDVLPLHICCFPDIATEQTCYIILDENNEFCYVQEDAIDLTTPRWIDNSEIGRYFCKFENTHYVPNKMLAKLYPDDAAITAKTILKK